eukprot:GHVO01013708.1.p1 GENE.GHVO01013708.1~~GHVO01013708.1.p1  ORF type:complete len:120 (-),score=4.89 GHVO01013708.1:48-407(-)
MHQFRFSCFQCQPELVPFTVLGMNARFSKEVRGPYTNGKLCLLPRYDRCHLYENTCIICASLLYHTPTPTLPYMSVLYQPPQPPLRCLYAYVPISSIRDSHRKAFIASVHSNLYSAKAA